ncbi:translation initiation factor IF-2-like isoform X1 [Mya arenaria]|uniref:translation initiation factor IF-2-like isoform X1 n=1 Tax=Mya arenaria TaxID=6604 RepID=UPI0022E05A8C|nr:translation initiation factor IF-2-like isoform X1 [Mya arenaria]
MDCPCFINQYLPEYFEITITIHIKTGMSRQIFKLAVTILAIWQLNFQHAEAGLMNQFTDFVDWPPIIDPDIPQDPKIPADPDPNTTPVSPTKIVSPPETPSDLQTGNTDAASPGRPRDPIPPPMGSSGSGDGTASLDNGKSPDAVDTQTDFLFPTDAQIGGTDGGLRGPLLPPGGGTDTSPQGPIVDESSALPKVPDPVDPSLPEPPADPDTPRDVSPMVTGSKVPDSPLVSGTGSETGGLTPGDSSGTGDAQIGSDVNINISPTCKLLGTLSIENFGKNSERHRMLRKECLKEKKRARQLQKKKEKNKQSGPIEPKGQGRGNPRGKRAAKCKGWQKKQGLCDTGSDPGATGGGKGKGKGGGGSGGEKGGGKGGGASLDPKVKTIKTLTPVDINTDTGTVIGGKGKGGGGGGGKGKGKGKAGGKGGANQTPETTTIDLSNTEHIAGFGLIKWNK